LIPVPRAFSARKSSREIACDVGFNRVKWQWQQSYHFFDVDVDEVLLAAAAAASAFLNSD
jgi:hypothetical protein